MNLEEHKKELMKDPEFKAACEQIAPWSHLATEITRTAIKSGIGWRRLAKEAGISRKALDNILAFDTSARVGDIQKVCRVLGLKLEIMIEEAK